MKDPSCRKRDIERIKMSGREFYQFIKSPESQGRYFIDMGDVILEASQEDARAYKTEQDRRYYIRALERDEAQYPSIPLRRRADAVGKKSSETRQ